MIDPASSAHVAQMDQLAAAFRGWAESLHVAQSELMKQGVPQETALDIARDWLLTIISKMGVPDD
jgi:hypothetical protein